MDISCSLIHLRPTEFWRLTAFSRASLVKNYESFSVVRHQIEGEIPVKSAITSTLLTDLMDELGIKSPRRYISDDVSSWYFEVNFPQTYCEKSSSTPPKLDNERAPQNEGRTAIWVCRFSEFRRGGTQFLMRWSKVTEVCKITSNYRSRQDDMLS